VLDHAVRASSFSFVHGPPMTRQVRPQRELTGPSNPRWHKQCSQNHLSMISRFSPQPGLLALFLHSCRVGWPPSLPKLCTRLPALCLPSSSLQTFL